MIQKLDLTLKKGKKYLALVMGDLRPSRITIDHKFKNHRGEMFVTFWYWRERGRRYETVSTVVLELIVRYGRERAKELRDIGEEGKRVPK